MLILIKNAIKNAIAVAISLYMSNLENPENQNSAIAASTSEADTHFAHFNLRTINNVIYLPLLIAFSSLSDINTALKIGLTIT